MQTADTIPLQHRVRGVDHRALQRGGGRNRALGPQRSHERHAHTVAYHGEQWEACYVLQGYIICASVCSEQGSQQAATPHTFYRRSSLSLTVQSTTHEIRFRSALSPSPLLDHFRVGGIQAGDQRHGPHRDLPDSARPVPQHRLPSPGTSSARKLCRGACAQGAEQHYLLSQHMTSQISSGLLTHQRTTHRPLTFIDQVSLLNHAVCRRATPVLPVRSTSTLVIRSQVRDVTNTVSVYSISS